MVLDTSALLAILSAEPEQAAFIAAIAADGVRLISAASYVEAGIVVESRRGAEGRRDFDQFVSQAALEIVPLTSEHGDIAREAYRQFGRGHHPAGLNFGDCFAYALATSSGEPLLCKGDDFPKTDIVIWSE